MGDPRSQSKLEDGEFDDVKSSKFWLSEISLLSAVQKYTNMISAASPALMMCSRPRAATDSHDRHTNGRRVGGHMYK